MAARCTICSIPAPPTKWPSFEPRVKRHLDIAPLIPEISDGMAGAVTYGTARSVRVNFNEEEILGKTGTCSRAGTRYGWFASYANTNVGRIVVVVFLQGGRPTYGPKAAEISGRMYRNLYDHDFFIARPTPPADTADVKPVGRDPAISSVAFQCHLTRIATKRATRHVSLTSHPWLIPLDRGVATSQTCRA